MSLYPVCIRSLRGSMFISMFLITMLSIVLMVSLVRHSSLYGQIDVRQAKRNQSMAIAQQGLARAMKELRQGQGVVIGNQMPPISQSVERGRYDLTLARISQDVGLVEAWTTGYCYAPTGSVVDPMTGKRAYMSVIRARYRILLVSDFFAATPGTLRIAYGSDLTEGTVYGNTLIFQDRGGLPGPPTQIHTAYYVDTVDPPNGVSPDGDVVYQSNPQNAQHLTTPLRLPNLDLTMREYYAEKASSVPEQMLNPAVSFAGPRSPPPGAVPHVYFSPSDLVLGEPGDPLIVDGTFVVYVQGKAEIRGNIQPANESSWLAVLAEDDIFISAGAPNDIEINGTFVTNGALTALGTKNDLTFIGGAVAHGGISLSQSFQGVRRYKYKTSNDPELLLPNTSSLLESQVMASRY